MKVATSIPGCFEFRPKVQVDLRGSFVKVYDEGIANSLAAAPRWTEVFWSRSRQNVVRGMHFQLPPADISKLVFCSEGAVFDVVVDLRPGPNFGTTHCCVLHSAVGNALFVPKGCAHGFAVTTEFATVCYLQSGPYDSNADAGIYWHSISAPWPIEEEDALVSDRDKTHPPLNDLATPFVSSEDPSR